MEKSEIIDYFKLYNSSKDFKTYVDKLMRSHNYVGYSLEDILSLKLVQGYGLCVKNGQNTYSAATMCNL